MNAIANNESELDLRNRFDDLKLQKVLGLFTLIFWDQGVGLRTEKLAEFPIENTTVFFSPLDFVPAL